MRKCFAFLNEILRNNPEIAEAWASAKEILSFRVPDGLQVCHQFCLSRRLPQPSLKEKVKQLVYSRAEISQRIKPS